MNRAMPVEMRLVQIAESMESAKISGWLKAEGERVEAGEVIAEVETDKTIVELQAPASGTLVKIHAPPGSATPSVGMLLAEIMPLDATSTGRAEAGDARPSMPFERPEEVQPVASVAVSTTAGPESTAAVVSEACDVPATPLARRMAEVLNLDLRRVPGTAPDGRVGRRDVQRAHQRGAPHPELDYVEERLSPMRRVTAERMQVAKQTVPHFYLQIECAADALVQLRQRVNAADAESKLSVTDLVIRGTALALRRVPEANSSFADGVLRIFRICDVAVAVNTSNGLITPIIRRADEKDVRTISAELRALIARARAGRLRPEEYSGGTFTISNLGMEGIGMLLPIVNPPQSCILGVGAIAEQPVVRDGQVGVGLRMSCTLAADHRAIDGATGARFLAEFRRVIEEPARLLAGVVSRRGAQ